MIFGARSQHGAVVEAVADPDVMLTDAGFVHTNPDS